MADKLNPPWMKGMLTNCVAVLWPGPIEVKVHRDNRHLFHLLTDYAHVHGFPVLAPKDHFQITFNFDFIGFEQVKGSWKIVYEIRNRVECRLCGDDKKTKLAEMSDTLKRDLRYMAGIKSEELVEVAPVKEVTETVTIYGKKHDEVAWRFVTEPTGCK